MSKFVYIIVIFCFLTLSIGKSNCGVINTENGITPTISIQAKNDIVQCGSLICPAGSQRCVVTKNNNPSNTAQLITREKCFDSFGNLIQQNEFIEAGDPNNIISTNIETSGSGTYNNINNNAILQNQIQQNIHKTITQALQTVQNNLKTT